MCVKVGGRAEGRYVVAEFVTLLGCCSLLFTGGEAAVEEGNAPVVEKLASVDAASNTDVLRWTVVFGFVGFVDTLLLIPPSRLSVVLLISTPSHCRLTGLLLSVVLLEILKVGALSLTSRMDCITRSFSVGCCVVDGGGGVLLLLDDNMAVGGCVGLDDGLLLLFILFVDGFYCNN